MSRPFLALASLDAVLTAPEPESAVSLVACYLKSRTDYQTAQQIADGTGLSRDQARTALSYLLKRQKVDRQTPSRYAEGGRVARQGWRWAR